jgi:uncharacterized protein (DUF885 family)
MRLALAVLAVGIAASCGGRPPSMPTKEPEPVTSTPSESLRRELQQAAAGVTDADLATVLRDHWGWMLADQPTRATRLGVHDYDDRIGERNAAANDARRAERRKLLERARAIPSARLSDADRLSQELFVDQLDAEVGIDVCRFEEWTVDPRSNPVTEWNELPDLHPMKSPEDGDHLVARYRRIPAAVDDDIAALQRGVARGVFANAESTRRVIEMVDKQIAQPIDEWPLIAPGRAVHDGWSADRSQRFAADLRAAAVDVKGALERYRAFLAEHVLPKARPEEQSGLESLPDGRVCYAALIRLHTTLDLASEEIHRIGLEQIERTDRELAELGARALGTTSLADTLARLRGDPKLYFTTAEEVEEAARAALADANARTPEFFGILPRAPCTVRRIPDYEAPYTTIAYYRPPHADGSKPGEYFVNVLAPETRPRFEARVLAVHEAVPGHHLQIAIAQELAAVPAFRRHAEFTAYVEGWALYTERLADEMGLYRDDLDRIGVASFDAWRAGRLVVDTGIHRMGWSRTRAKRFFEEHSALSLVNIDNEVDRYIAWPGQALAYKLGELEIRGLRKKAEAALGERFQLPAFHDTVLESGAVTLPILRSRVQAWMGRAGIVTSQAGE